MSSHFIPQEKQQAIIIQRPGYASLVSDRPIPKLRDGYILVKTAAVAINPTDWKHIDKLPSSGALIGCDYAGTVVSIGNGVTKAFTVNDKVCGFVHGSDAVEHENGAFAEYIVAKGDIQIKIPDKMKMTDAATIGGGIITVGQGLYQSLRLPLPTQPAKEPYPVLVYGGSTATGTLAIQFAKLSGLTVIATSSAQHFDLCKSLGADAIFDYHDSTCGQQIFNYTQGKLRHAFDCIGLASSASICAAALSISSGTVYSSLLPVKFPRTDVDSKTTLAYTAPGEYFRLGDAGPEFPAREIDFNFAKMFTKLAEALLTDGKLKAHPVSIRQGGLSGVLNGIQELRVGKVSGKKLVYTIT